MSWMYSYSLGCILDIGLIRTVPSTDTTSMQLLINLYCVGMICINPFFSLFLMGLLKNNSRAPGRTGPISWMYACSHGCILDMGRIRTVHPSDTTTTSLYNNSMYLGSGVTIRNI